MAGGARRPERESGARRGPAHPCGRRAGAAVSGVRRAARHHRTPGRPVRLRTEPGTSGRRSRGFRQRSRHRADPAGRAARRRRTRLQSGPGQAGRGARPLPGRACRAYGAGDLRSRFHRRSRSQDRRDSCDRNADRRRRHPSGTPARSRRTPRRGDPDAVRQGHHPRPGGRADRTRRRRTWPDRRGRHQFRHALRVVRLSGGPGRIRRGGRQGTQASGQAARREGAWRPRVRPDARISRRDPAVPQPADGRCRLPGRRMGRGLRHQRRPCP